MSDQPQQQLQQQQLPPQAAPMTSPQPQQQQPVTMAPGAVQYVSGQQSTVQFIPAAPQMVVPPQTVS